MERIHRRVRARLVFQGVAHREQGRLRRFDRDIRVQSRISSASGFATAAADALVRVGAAKPATKGATLNRSAFRRVGFWAMPRSPFAMRDAIRATGRDAFSAFARSGRSAFYRKTMELMVLNKNSQIKHYSMLLAFFIGVLSENA
jgi:hypothetical protein